MSRTFGSKNKVSKMITMKCNYCGSNFQVYPSRIKKGVKYCSYFCSGKGGKPKQFTEIQKQKFSLLMKENWRLGILKSKPAWNKGTKGMTKAWNKGLKGYHAGKIHYNWQGGKSFEPYGIKFNQELKEKIRKRDNYICQECGKTKKELKRKLNIHHIDYNKRNNGENNLISLCDICHGKTNFKRSEWIKYYKIIIQKKICIRQKIQFKII